MSTGEQAQYILNSLSEEQLAAFVTLFGRLNPIPEEAPDEWDKAIIADSKENNSKVAPFNDFVKELGFDSDDIVTPNSQTLGAMKELENNGGTFFVGTTKELFSNLAEE